jgi:hypothetical protein
LFTFTQALILPGWLCSIVFTVFSLLSTEKYGSGTHVWDIPVSHFAPLSLIGWCAEFAYLLSTSCTKCSTLFFYRRLTKGTYNKRWKYAILTAITFTAMYTVAFVFVLAFSCSPVDAYWKSRNPYYQKEYSCIDTKSSTVLSAALSVVSDLYSVLMPCIMLRNFGAPGSQKIALNIIFSLGLLVVAAGSVRTYYIQQVSHSLDKPYIGFDIVAWAQLETHLALICASSPALRVFFRTHLKGSVQRVITSVRDSRHESRSMSKRLPDESSDSSQGGDSIPLTSVVASKHNSTANLDKHSFEAISSHHSAPHEEFAVNQVDFERFVRDLEANRPPPVAYPLRERRPTEHEYHVGSPSTYPMRDGRPSQHGQHKRSQTTSPIREGFVPERRSHGNYLCFPRQV